MHMARSTYYFEISRNDVIAERNQEILEEIKSVFVENNQSAAVCGAGRGAADRRLRGLCVYRLPPTG